MPGFGPISSSPISASTGASSPPAAPVRAVIPSRRARAAAFLLLSTSVSGGEGGFLAAWARGANVVINARAGRVNA